MYDGRQVRAVVDSFGSVQGAYLHDTHGVLAKWSAGQRFHAMRDAQDTVVAWADDGGALYRTPRDSFGARMTAPTQATAYGFGSYTEDVTGLVHGDARYYDPETGTWLSEDPMPLEDRYAYANGSPLLFTDPTGLFPEYAATGRGVRPDCKGRLYGDTAHSLLGKGSAVAGFLTGVVVFGDGERDAAVAQQHVKIAAGLTFLAMSLDLAEVQVGYQACQRGETYSALEGIWGRTAFVGATWGFIGAGY